MILVTGATGSIGRYVVGHLTNRGSNFKALVRDRVRGEALGCPYAVADFNVPETLGPAFAGAERVLLNGAVDEAMVRQQQAVVDAAKVAGVKHIVRVSAAGASAKSDRQINVWHAKIDAHLEASGVAWCLLRPTYFMQNIFGSAPSIRSEGKLYGGFRDGRLALIDCSDIAACAAVLLTEPASSRQAFVITGRETLSFAEVAATLSARLGRPVTYINRPSSEVVASMISRGMAPSIADSFGKMIESFASGGASTITTSVQDITGREPRTLDDFLNDNLDRFR
jgi:NAD(P)H dehydrogenase (quinone)